jgi:hypothetical protein
MITSLALVTLAFFDVFSDAFSDMRTGLTPIVAAAGEIHPPDARRKMGVLSREKAAAPVPI